MFVVLPTTGYHVIVFGVLSFIYWQPALSQKITMTIRLKPTRKQLDHFLLCAKIDADQLNEVINYLDNLISPPLLPDQLLQGVKQLLPDDAEILLERVFSLSMIARETESTPLEMIRAVREAMDDPEEQAKWDSIATQMRSLLESTPVFLITKAMELSYDYANLLKKVRILTDLRPLYDQDGDNVEGGVVTHTLRLSYFSDDGKHELSLALDLQDIESLRGQCDRAITKAVSLRTLFTESTGKPCLISGEVENKDD